MAPNIHLTVSKKNVTSEDCPLRWSSNTVDYITATFDLDEEWSACDLVRAVWVAPRAQVATLLDSNGTCVVPHEVLSKIGKVYVNLYGIVYEDGDEFTRITTYPFNAIRIDGDAKIDGSETAPITPSQFEQFVQAVKTETEKVTGMTATAETLPAGEDATASYSDGVLALGIPRGDKGDTGERGEQGIPGERGETGVAGNGIASIAKTGTAGLVDTYTIEFTDGTSATFTVTNGAKGDTGDTGNGIASAVLNADYTLTLNFTDGTNYTTTPIRGARGETGAQGLPGVDGFSPTATVIKEGDTATITITDINGTTAATVRDGSDADARWGNISGTLSEQTDLQSALNQKVDKVAGKGLSTEDYTATDKTKLTALPDADTLNANLSQKANTSDVATALANKQDKLTFDDTPTEDSENPVTSGGLYSLLEPVASEATGQSILATETAMNTTLDTLLTNLVDAHLTTEAGDQIVQDLMQGNILLAQLADNIEESGVF